MRYLILGLLALSFGCSQSTLLGRRSEPISADAVRVYVHARPSCQVEEVATISVPYALGQNMAIDAFKKEAASYGADIVIVSTLTMTDGMEYQGSALAGRCAY